MLISQIKIEELLEICTKLIDVTAEFIVETGGCDHEIGICMCSELRLIQRAEDLVKECMQE